MTLLIRPRPHFGEGRQGYLLRIAAANALESPTQLSTAMLVSSKLFVPMMTIRGPIRGLPKIKIEEPDALPGRYWNVRTCRYCPACLDDKPIFRDLWQLGFYTACHHHGTALQDSCHACRQTIIWDRRWVNQCDCGADLNSSPVVEASPSALKVSSMLADAWNNDAKRQDIKGGGLESKLHRIWVLGSYALACGLRVKRLRDVHDLQHAVRLVEAADRTMSCWPNRFHELLDAKASGHGTRKLNRSGSSFGSLYREIFAKQRAVEHEDLRAAFEQYVQTKWEVELAVRGRQQSKRTLEAHEWISVTQAARELNWKTPRLRAAIENGVVEGKLLELASGRVTCVVRRSSLTLFKAKAKT
mgnify:CR=1 FL=1